MQVLNFVTSNKTLTIVALLLLCFNIILLIFLLFPPTNNVTLVNTSKHLRLQYDNSKHRYFSECFKSNSKLQPVKIVFSDLDHNSSPQGYKNNGLWVYLVRTKDDWTINMQQDFSSMLSKNELLSQKKPLETILYGQIVGKMISSSTQEISVCFRKRAQEVKKNPRLNPFSIEIIK